MPIQWFIQWKLGMRYEPKTHELWQEIYIHILWYEYIYEKLRGGC